MRVVNEGSVPAAPDDVFAVLADAETWTDWFPGCRRCAYAGERPYGVGTPRELTVVPMGRIREHVVAWDVGKRFGYEVESLSMPIARALVEAWDLEATETGSRVRWTFAIDPRMIMRLSRPERQLRRTFDTALEGLTRHLGARA